jgi:hypothetical protein
VLFVVPRYIRRIKLSKLKKKFKVWWKNYLIERRKMRTPPIGPSLEEFFAPFFHPLYNFSENMISRAHSSFLVVAIGLIAVIAFTPDISPGYRFLILSTMALTLALHGRERYVWGVYEAYYEMDTTGDLIKSYTNYRTKKFREIDGGPVFTPYRSIVSFLMAYYIGTLLKDLGDYMVFGTTVTLWLFFVYTFFYLKKQYLRHKVN